MRKTFPFKLSVILKFQIQSKYIKRHNNNLPTHNFSFSLNLARHLESL